MVERAEREILGKDKEAASLREIMQALEMAQSFLVKLPKMRPPEDDKDEAGIGLMRSMLADPAAVVERLHANPAFQEALREKGWLDPAPIVPHRPSKAILEHREAYAARKKAAEPPPEEDSTLRGMLESAQAGGETH